jgi:hypothetical protein
MVKKISNLKKYKYTNQQKLNVLILISGEMSY